MTYTHEQWHGLSYLTKDLIQFSPKKSCLSFFLILFRSLSAGMNLLLILPLLQVGGFHVLGHSSASKKLTHYLSVCHIPVTLSSLLLLFFSSMTLVATMYFFEEIQRTQWQEKYQYYLREKIYTSLLKVRWTFFIADNPSRFLHIITSQLQSAWQCHFQWLQIVSQLILIAVYFMVAIAISWKMTLLSSAVALLLLAIIRPLNRQLPQRNRVMLQQKEMLFSSLYEQLNAFKTVKSCHQEAFFIERILQKSRLIAKELQRFSRVHAASKWGYSVGSALSFSGLIYVAITIFQLPQDALLLLILIFARLMPRVASVQQSWQYLLVQLVGYTHLLTLLEDTEKNREACLAHPRKNCVFHSHIVFDKVSFAYPSDSTKETLTHFSMHIKKNTTTLLIGPSGSGKTTVADLLVGLLEPTHGSIWIDNQRLNEEYIASWRKSIAYITQDPFLFDASIRENLELFIGEQEDAVLWDVLERVLAADFVKRLKHGLDTMIGDRGIRLSGGEGQRIVLARALLMQPTLLIMDESTNALDEDTIASLQASLAHLHGALTILVISHQSSMRQFADHVVVLSPVRTIVQSTEYA